MALTGIIQRRNLKLVLTGTPPIEGEIVYATDTDEFGWLAANGVDIIWTNFETPNSIDWGNLTGDINLQTDLQAALADKANLTHGHDISDVQDLTSELNNRYLKSNYISISNGAGDADKPVVTNADGLIDNSLVASTAFSLVGDWTPVNGNEYPTVVGLTTGDYFLITGVNTNTGYTYLTGDLVNETTFNSDQLTWTTNGWLTIQGNVNPDAYLRLDGTTAMVGDLDVGDNFLQLVKDGILDTDGVSKLQMDTADALKSNIGHIHNGVGGELAYEVADVAIQAHITSTNVNPHTTSFSQLVETPTDFVGRKGQRLTVNDTEDGVIYEPSSGSGMFSGEFIFDASSTIIPAPAELADGQLRQNNGNSALVTDIWVSKFDRFGTDRTYGLNLLRATDFFGIVDSVTGAFALYKLTANPVDGGGADNFLTFVVEYETDSGIAFIEGASIVGEIAVNGAKFFPELQDVPDDYIGTANQFLKVTEGDLTDGDSVEFKALEINDIGFDFAGNGAADSTLQVELDTKLGGAGKTDATILEPSTSLVTTIDGTDGPGTTETLLNYTYTGTGNSPLAIDNKVLLKVGAPDQLVDILGTVNLDLTFKNEIEIKALDSSYLNGKNLVSRTATAINTPPTQGPAAYEEDVVLGDSDVKTVIRATVGFDAYVRKGVFGATDDWLIHTDEQFTALDFTTTQALAVTNESGLVTINTYVGIDDTSGLSQRIFINETNIGTIGNLTTTATDLVEAVNEVSTSLSGHESIVTGNPHAVTQTEVGLANVDNTSDINKPVSTLTQTALDLKWDGLSAFGDMVVDNTVGFKTDATTTVPNSNILDYGVTSGDPLLADGTALINIAESGVGINLNGVLFNPLLMKNNTALQAYKEDYTEFKNLISRSGIEGNTGTPALYNSDVTIGDSGVLTVIRETSGFAPVVRKGTFGDTDDFPIYTTDDFLIGDYTTTGNDATYEVANSNIQTHISDNGNPHQTTVGNIIDTNITSAVNGEVLTFDGTDWINQSPAIAAAVVDIIIDGSETTAGNATKINELLASLRLAGILAT